MICVPESAVPFIDMQRTGKGDAIRRYADSISEDFEDMRPYLPDTAQNVADIGCGLCGIDVMLWHQYSGVPVFHLIDRDGEERPKYGYVDGIQHYSSFATAEELMRANGMKEFSYRLIPGSTYSDLPELPKMDLIVSLLSCGFHYPLEYYLRWIVKNLAEDGRVFIDIRHGGPGLLAMLNNFKEIVEVRNTKKYVRLCAWEPIE